MRVSEAIFANLAPVFGASQIWPNAAPEDVNYPMMIYVIANRELLNTVECGYTHHAKNRVQIYVFAKEFEEAESLRDQVISIMNNQTNLPSCLALSDSYQFESTVQAHLIVIEFSMWEQTT